MKASISIQTIFYIMMSIVMVVIIVFGISQIMDVEDQITDQDRIYYQNQLKDAFEFCTDPINRGSLKKVEVSHPSFNSVCIIGSDQKSGDYSSFDELNTISETNNNIVFIQSTLNSNYKMTPTEYNIIDSFYLDIKPFEETKCWTDKNTGTITLSIECE